MYKRKILYTILVLAVIVGVSALVKATEKSENKTSKAPLELKQEIYFAEAENRKLTYEIRDIRGTTLLDTLEDALVKLREEPKNEVLSVAVPETLEVYDLSLKDGIVTINVSGNYGEMKTGQEMFCRAALVWTFTGFYFVDGVEILVNGKPLTKTNGEPFGAMGRGDLIVDAQIEAEPTNATRLLTLYFANSETTGLVSEERKVEVNPNQPIERYILEQLIVGPREEGHTATIPVETKIRDIQTADGICYVDLSLDFVSKHGGGSTGEVLTVYSIVNSLCELTTIEKVQFLIEGEKQNEYKGHLEFGKPFEPQKIE